MSMVMVEMIIIMGRNMKMVMTIHLTTSYEKKTFMSIHKMGRNMVIKKELAERKKLED